jgi:hypothetical protein
MTLSRDIIARVRLQAAKKAARMIYRSEDDGFCVEHVGPCTCRLHGTRVAGIVTIMERRLDRTCCGRQYD